MHECRHKLFAPQVFHVGAVESFTFTAYSLERFEVTATVSYEDCSCQGNRRRTCKDNGEVFSQATGRSRQGEQGCMQYVAMHSQCVMAACFMVACSRISYMTLLSLAICDQVPSTIS